MDVSFSRARAHFVGELIMADVDVAIIGAGPAGSAAAIALARNWITCCFNGPRKPESRSEPGSESSRFQNRRGNGSWTWAREKAGGPRFLSAPMDATPGLPNSSA